MRYYIHLLGNRDIQTKEKISPFEYKNKNCYIIDRENFRKKTKILLDNLDNWINKIEIPLIEPVLNKYKINKIILIATDQKNKERNNQDTLYEAEIIERILKKRYGYKNVEILKYYDSAVNEKMWRKFFTNEVFDKIENNVKIICNVSGGTPQERNGFVLSIVEKNLKHEILEVVDGEIRSSYFYKEVEKLLEKNILKELILNYNYYGCYKIAEKSNYFRNFKNYFLKAHNRLNFVQNDDIIYLVKNDRKKSFVSLNKIEKLKILILDLLDNLEVDYKNKNYNSLLSKYHNLIEKLCVFVILKNTKDKVIYNLYELPLGINYLNDKNFKEKIKEKYKNEIEKMGKDMFGQSFNVNKLSIYFYVAAACYFDKNKGEIIYKLFNYLKNNGKNIRNFLSTTHGLFGLTEKDFKKLINIENFLEIRKKVYSILDEKDQGNVFDQINKELLEKIDNL